MIDASAVVSDLIPALHATSTADLVYFSEAGLYRSATDALNRLAQAVRLLIAAETVSVGAAVNEVVAGTRVVRFLQVRWNGSRLQPSTSLELDALSDSWLPSDQSVEPERYALDQRVWGRMQLYPATTAAGTLGFTYAQSPADVSSGSPFISDAPDLAEDWLFFATLSEARSRQSDARMPEVAAVADRLAGLLQSAMNAYYGG